MFTIIVEAEGHEPKRYDFEQDEVKIGRDPGSDIHLASSNVSKRHARIVNREGRYFIVDRKSTNGTFVNGARVTTPQVLKDGDRIFVGDFVLIFEAEAEKSVPTPPPIKKKRKPIEVKPAAPQDDNTSLLITSTPPPVPPKSKKKKEDSVAAPPPPPPSKKKRSSRKRSETQKIEPPVVNPSDLDTEIPAPAEPVVAKKEPKSAVGLDVDLVSSLFYKLLDSSEFGEEFDIFAPDLYSDDLIKAFESHFVDAAKGLGVSTKDAENIKDAVIKEVLGFGPLTELLYDDTAVEIFANSRGELWVDRIGGKREFLDGFSNVDAFALATSRISSLCKAESAEIEEFPFVISCKGKFVAVAKLSAHGADSWVRVMKLPLDDSLFARMDVKIKGVLENIASAGRRVLVVGSSFRARAEFAVSMLSLIGDDTPVSFLGAPEVAESASIKSKLSLNFSADSLEFSDRLSEAITANDAHWLVASSLIGVEYPVLDMLSAPVKGILWLVPAFDSDRVLRVMKNLLVMQSSQSPEVVANFIADSIDFVIEVGIGHDGKSVINSVAKISGAKSGNITVESMF